MATRTTTIRVPEETRDRLAAHAKARGLSLSAMLTRLAERAEREVVFRAEREATIADSRRPEVAEEERDWSGSLADGIG